MANPTVDKLEAVFSQLETASWLWFNHGDTVSIHTLTDAAFGVLIELYDVQRIPRPLPFDDVRSGNPADPSARKLRDKLREAGSYGKHARHDHHLAYEYSETFIQAYLTAAISAYSRLRPLRSGGTSILFWIWFGSHHPDLVETMPCDRSDIERAARMSRVEFFSQFGGDFIGVPPRRPNGD